jgi:hypothetical protein
MRKPTDVEQMSKITRANSPGFDAACRNIETADLAEYMPTLLIEHPDTVAWGPPNPPGAIRQVNKPSDNFCVHGIDLRLHCLECSPAHLLSKPYKRERWWRRSRS